MKNKGFTLIELLVVVAVIGVLASIIITSLAEAQHNARIANIKSSLRNALNQAELYYIDNNYSYTGLCSDTTIQSILLSLPTSITGCYVHRNTINTIEYGLAVSYNNAHFVAGPGEVLQLDAINTGASTNWNTALQRCFDAGKILPQASSLRAFGEAAPGVITGNHWGSTEASSTHAFRMAFGSIGIVNEEKTKLRSVHCAQ